MASTNTVLTNKQIQDINDNRIVCRSNYKMHCFCCNRTINRGDLITQVREAKGMTLRAVHIAPNHGYIPTTGSRWVHVDCSPPYTWTGWTGYTYSP